MTREVPAGAYAEVLAHTTPLLQESAPDESAATIQQFAEALAVRLVEAERPRGVTVSGALQLSRATLTTTVATDVWALSRRVDSWRADRSHGGLLRGQAITAAAQQLRARVAEKATARRAAVPYHRRRASTQSLATWIAEELSTPDLEVTPDTVLNHLCTLVLK